MSRHSDTSDHAQGCVSGSAWTFLNVLCDFLPSNATKLAKDSADIHCSQEALTRPGAVERFLPTQQAARIRQTFMPMQALDLSDKGRVARQRALNPVTAKDYVLKPNLEGGGHNVYRDDIAGFLSTLPEEKWQNYILMRCIEPVEQEGHLLLAEELYQGPVIAELGAIGNCIWRREGSSATIVANRLAGWTLKVKPTAVNEMSVAKGYGSFSTPCLLERDGV